MCPNNTAVLIISCYKSPTGRLCGRRRCPLSWVLGPGWSAPRSTWMRFQRTQGYICIWERLWEVTNTSYRYLIGAISHSYGHLPKSSEEMKNSISPDTSLHEAMSSDCSGDGTRLYPPEDSPGKLCNHLFFDLQSKVTSCEKRHLIANSSQCWGGTRCPGFPSTTTREAT